MKDRLMMSLQVSVENHPIRPAYSVVQHKHDDASLCLVVSGKGYCVIEGSQYALEPRMSLYVPAGKAHSLVDKSRSRMTVFVIRFNHAIAQQHDSLLNLLSLHAEPQRLSIPTWQDLSLTLRQMLYEQNVTPPHYETALQTLLTTVLLHLARAAGTRKATLPLEAETSEQRVRSFLDYVSKTYYQNHTLSEAVKATRLSQRRFSSLCKEIVGQSFINYVNKNRIDRALFMLKSTELSVAAIAYQVGFEELSTFYRAFRKHVGNSPREIRNDAD